MSCAHPDGNVDSRIHLAQRLGRRIDAGTQLRALLRHRVTLLHQLQEQRALLLGQGLPPLLVLQALDLGAPEVVQHALLLPAERLPVLDQVHDGTHPAELGRVLGTAGLLAGQALRLGVPCGQEAGPQAMGAQRVTQLTVLEGAVSSGGADQAHEQASRGGGISSTAIRHGHSARAAVDPGGQRTGCLAIIAWHMPPQGVGDPQAVAALCLLIMLPRRLTRLRVALGLKQPAEGGPLAALACSHLAFQALGQGTHFRSASVVQAGRPLCDSCRFLVTALGDERLGKTAP